MANEGDVPGAPIKMYRYGPAFEYELDLETGELVRISPVGPVLWAIQPDPVETGVEC